MSSGEEVTAQVPVIRMRLSNHTVDCYEVG